MPTLVLTLAGPMQAWGTGSRFASRQTDLAPSKSGVFGMVAAAQGVRRTEPLTELAALRFGVRLDQPGRVASDFQTARADDGRGASISHRYYLHDAVFLAALESDDAAFLERIRGSLKRPVFPLFLGRRACPPSGPVRSALHEHDIETVFQEVPWQATEVHQRALQEFPGLSVETRIDAMPGDQGTVRQHDVPVTFDPERREHAWREVRFGSVWVPNPGFSGAGGSDRDGTGAPATRVDDAGLHDPFAAFEEEE